VSSTPLKLLIVDDNDLFVSALEGFLETEASLEVIGRAANGAVAVELAADLQPDVVLMDLSMPSVDGFEATALVREQAPESAIVVLTGSDDPADQERARAAGAAGYVTKDRILGELVATIHSVTSPP
jgi:two-component system, NarL family, nitrate/nitrite response regulator NarL